MEQDEGLETLCSLFPTAGALVWEEFRVEGLSREKSYTVAVDGTELGTYSGEELAVNIIFPEKIDMTTFNKEAGDEEI